MQSVLVGTDLNGCAFVCGSLSFLDKISCGLALYFLESFQSECFFAQALNSKLLRSVPLYLIFLSICRYFCITCFRKHSSRCHLYFSYKIWSRTCARSLCISWSSSYNQHEPWCPLCQVLNRISTGIMVGTLAPKQKICI